MAFPDSSSFAAAHWRAVFFKPNFDTPERLVAGVVASVGGSWHLVRASALERLKCLYGDEAAVALEAIQIGLDHLETVLPETDSDFDLSQIVSGLELGPRMEAEAKDPEELATHWLRLISSLHSIRKERLFDLVAAEAPASMAVDTVARDISRDRLPVLVMERMLESAPQTRAMFNPHVHKLERNEGARLLTHRAYVAFTGKHVAANFATLKPGRQKIAVDISKRLMWDLEQHRDSEESLLPRHSHEMILYHPAEDDPTITPKQFQNVMEVVHTLREEGDNREIKVLPFVSVPTISDHILHAEGIR